MASSIELGALAGTRPPARRPQHEPDPLGSERRAMLVAVVATPIVALVGVALLVTGVGGESRFPGLLALIGLATPMFAVQLWQIDGRSASRIRAFAAENGFRFEELVDSPGHAGSVFSLGAAQQRLMLLRGRMFGHVVEVGNLRYRLASRWAPLVTPGYVAIRLPDRLPHAIVTARPAWRSRLGLHPRAEDRLEPMGDGRLRVFAHAETAHLVRSLLSGEVLAVIERISGRYCVEIVGDTLFLHTRWPVSTGSHRRWRAVLDDVADVCRALDASPVWSVLERQPARTSQSFEPLRSGLDERRLVWIFVLSLVTLSVAGTLLVVWLRDR